MAVCLTPWLMDAGSLGRSTVRPNKGMKQTKPEHNGASQLIPGVLRLLEGGTRLQAGVVAFGKVRLWLR